MVGALAGRCALALAAAAVLTSCGVTETRDASAAEDALASDELRIVAMSTRPHLVTGGDVLLAVEAGEDVDLSAVRVEVDGIDVTGRFAPAPPSAVDPVPPGRERTGVDGQGSGAEGEGGGGPETRVPEGRDGPDGRVAGGSGLRSLVGLLEGLPDGASRVVATAPGAEGDASLEVTSHPATGPIISGAHEEPFFCQTDAFELAAGGTLGPALDDDCSVEGRVDHLYLSSEDGAFKPYDPAAAPSDVAEARTLHGRIVPFIVRVETGTVNRAVYEIALLHDPADPAPDPWSRSGGWNGKLVYTHGGGCRSGWYQQGDRTGGVVREGLLDMGYAVASASLNVFGQNCNDLLASETHIMLKERFIERYGPPVYTIGTGGSGGSYQSHQTADNYPGVFDGIIVSSSFPDVTSATIFTLADARLLHHYFTETAPESFTREQQRAVSGFGSWGSIPNLSRGAARLDPTFEEGEALEEQGGEVSLPDLEALRYEPETNPGGIRATVYDHTVNVYGVDGATGFAARPLDNRGVQYGLAALENEVVSVSQFLDLNRRIGGFDRDLEHVPDRHRADPVAAERALSTGRILHGGGGLSRTPVIDYRTYTDHREGGDIHMIVHQHTTRARLEAANGHSDNHVMAVGGCWGFTEECPDLGVLFRQMDRWLMNVREDASANPLAEKVVGARPPGLTDHCWDERDGRRVRIEEELSFEGGGRCGELYPAYPTPRQVAGAPLTNDVVSCRLKPLERGDYPVAFTDREWAELEEIFPDGVCDWGAGDAHGEGYGGTWVSFGPSAVNRVD